MRPLIPILLFLVTFIISGCTSSTPENSVALSSLINYDEQTYTVFLNKPVTIEPTKLVSPDSLCTITPNLPLGLTIDNNCRISGTPSEISEVNSYEVTLTKAGVTETSNLWLEVLGAENFLGLSYPNSSYSFSTPQWITTISPILQGGYPEKCFSTPDLPLGLTLKNDCRISGYAVQAVAGRSYTIQAVSNGRLFSTELNLELTTSDISNGLVYNFDARLPSLAFPYTSECNASNMTWTDLGPHKLKAVLKNCNNDSGWKGSGVPSDPYRWIVNDSGLTFSTKVNQGRMGGDMTLSMWIRPHKVEMNILTGDIDDYSSYYDFRIENTRQGLLIDDRNSSRLTLSPIEMPTFEWHHLSLVRKNCVGSECSLPYSPYDPDGFSTIDVYLDGVKVRTFTADGSTRSLMDHSNGGGVSTSAPYSLGRADSESDQIPHLEIAQLKLFNRRLSSTEVLNDCQQMASLLPNAACRAGVRTVRLPDFNMAKNDCMTKSFSITDLMGVASAPGENILFNFSTSTDMQLFNDASCTTPTNSFTYSASSTSQTLFLKAPTSGLKKIVLTPLSTLTLPPREVTITTKNEPAAVQLSFYPLILTNGMNFTPSNIDCSGQMGFDVQLLDSAGQVTTSSRDRQITVTSLSAVADLPITTNFVAGSPLQSFTLSTAGTYTITVSTAGLPDFTFTLNHPGGYDCGPD